MEPNRPSNPSPDPEVGPPPWAQLPPGVEAGPPASADGDGVMSMEGVPVYDRVETRTNLRAVLLAAVLSLVVGAVGGFFVGRLSAKKAPTTLAQAIQMAARGQLPRGNVAGAFGGTGAAGGLGRFGAGNGGSANGGTGNGAGQANGQGTGRGFGGFGGFQGSITAVDGNTITVQTPAGPVKVVIGGNTSILKTASGSRADLTVGKTVQVRIDLNANSGGNGTVTAASIVAEQSQ